MFKNQLSLDDILHGMSYKQLIRLRDTRLERLEAERKEADRRANNLKRENTRNEILKK